MVFFGGECFGLDRYRHFQCCDIPCTTCRNGCCYPKRYFKIINISCRFARTRRNRKSSPKTASLRQSPVLPTAQSNRSSTVSKNSPKCSRPDQLAKYGHRHCDLDGFEYSHTQARRWRCGSAASCSAAGSERALRLIGIEFH